MGIFDRFSKVISSNMNALLDKAEDPQKSVDLLIEEMREQIRRGRQEVVSAVAAEKRLRTKVEEIDGQIEKWQRRAELAVKAGDESLAREALLFKKRLVEERDRAEALRAEQRAQALQLKDDLERADTKLKELDAKKGTIVARYKQARAGGGAEALGADGDGPTPFDELRRVEEKMGRAEAEAEAMEEARDVLERPTGSKMTQREIEARFADLENGATGGKKASGDDDVDDELQALRKKFRVAP
jgi:phage shock protein A